MTAKDKRQIKMSTIGAIQIAMMQLLGMGTGVGFN
jgi:hypothetical protein